MNSHFAELKASIVQALDERLSVLQSQVSDIEDKELQPLLQCEAIIERGVKSAMTVLTEGNIWFVEIKPRGFANCF